MFNNRDRDEPPRIDNGEPILQIHKSGPNIRITTNRRGFTLRATEKRATNGTIVVCDLHDRVTPRALVISYTGRPRVTLETRRGDAYACLAKVNCEGSESTTHRPALAVRQPSRKC